AALRQVRQAVRRLRESRQSARTEDRGRKRVRRAAQQRISHAAADHGRIRADVREGREGTRLSPLSAAGEQREPGLYQQRRPHPGRVSVLRLLRTKWLRGQRQGRAARLRAAGAARRSEIHVACSRLGQPAKLRQGGEEGDRRRLHGYPYRRGIRAACRTRGALGLCLRQHLAPAQLWYCRTLRSPHPKGRGRQKLLLSALAASGSAFSAAARSNWGTPTDGRSATGRSRPVPRAGAALGRRRPPSGINTRRASPFRDRTTPTATTTSTSTRPTKTNSAGRCCA